VLFDSPGTLSFLMPKISAKFPRGYSQPGNQMEVREVTVSNVRPISRYIAESVQDRDIVTMEL